MPLPYPDADTVPCSKCRRPSFYFSTIPDVKHSRHFHIYECSACNHHTWIGTEPCG